MAWTPPSSTFAVGEVLTAVTMNKLLNSLKFLGAATGQTVAAQVTTTSTSFVTLTGGPAVTVATGAHALVVVSALLSMGAKNGESIMTVAVSGATTIAASTTHAITFQQENTGSAYPASAAGIFLLTLTAGSNTFTAEYKRAGTGSAAAKAARRSIAVFPLP